MNGSNKGSIVLKLFSFLGLLYLTTWFYVGFRTSFYGLAWAINLILLNLGIFFSKNHKFWLVIMFCFGLIYYLSFYILLPYFLKSSECDNYQYMPQIGNRFFTSCDCQGIKVFNGSKSRCYGERLNYTDVEKWE